ncbi:MAG: ferrochelatase [Candidatus Obscuribacterales bacterium]|nr:ferrochelatase [Candidatus Obscuribacterales bacterium]
MSDGYDAILIVSFGGPEGLPDVMPFLENVTRGRNIPKERLLSVAHHYELFDGISPINGQNRLLIQALEKRLEEAGPSLPIYWGNRNWHPFLKDTLLKMKQDGIKKAVAFVTAAYSSYSSCRQYLEDIEQARIAVGDDAPLVEKIRAFYNHPAFIKVNATHLLEAIKQIPQERQKQCKIVFTAHSIPASMADNCAYADQLNQACKLVSEQIGINNWQLAYQSRSGPPSQPWLEPDICDYINHLHKQEQTKDLIVLPIGFISDHMEVIYDIDIEAKQLCQSLGINLVRASTAGTNPDFVEMVRELILEKIEKRDVEACACPPQCCPRPTR